MSKRQQKGEQASQEVRKGEWGVGKGERGVGVPPWGVDFTPAVPFAAFFKASCLKSHFISLMTSSPGGVHASVPCPHSIVCFFCCLHGGMVGTQGVDVYLKRLAEL